MRTISKVAFALSLATAACCWTAADSDALYGKSTAFRAQAHDLIELDSQAMVASSCGIRGEEWRVSVGKAVQRRIDAMASGVWPDPRSAAKLTAVMEVAKDTENELQLTISSMSQNDCETLRSMPAILRKLDALAQQGPVGAGARPAATVTAPRGPVYDCHFGQTRHYQLDLTDGRERLVANGESYPFDKGSGFWSAGSDSDPSIGGAFAISSKGPKPFVLMAQPAFEPGANLYIDDSLVPALYGDGTDRPGFFDRDETAHISAIAYCNNFTVSKVSRLACPAQFRTEWQAIRDGFCLVEGTDEPWRPKRFRFEVGHPETPQESWPEGVTLFLNPNAAVPLPPDFLPASCIVARVLGGALIKCLSGFHPVAQTMVATPREVS